MPPNGKSSPEGQVWSGDGKTQDMGSHGIDGSSEELIMSAPLCPLFLKYGMAVGDSYCSLAVLHNLRAPRFKACCDLTFFSSFQWMRHTGTEKETGENQTCLQPRITRVGSLPCLHLSACFPSWRHVLAPRSSWLLGDARVQALLHRTS